MWAWPDRVAVAGPGGGALVPPSGGHRGRPSHVLDLPDTGLDAAGDVPTLGSPASFLAAVESKLWGARFLYERILPLVPGFQYALGPGDTRQKPPERCYGERFRSVHDGSTGDGQRARPPAEPGGGACAGRGGAAGRGEDGGVGSAVRRQVREHGPHLCLLEVRSGNQTETGVT